MLLVVVFAGKRPAGGIGLLVVGFIVFVVDWYFPVEEGTWNLQLYSVVVVVASIAWTVESFHSVSIRISFLPQVSKHSGF